MSERRGKVITFYSYKGGVGRTFLLANVAATLRQWGASVLCVDWDLEAPGLHHYLRPASGPAEVGLLDVIEGFQPGLPLPWRQACVEGPALTRAAPRGGLSLLLAGGGGPTYSRRLQAIDWAKLYEAGLGDAIEAMRDEWRAAYDFVLVDSRTGLNDLAGICTIQLPDLLVLVGTASQQSIDGLRAVLDMVHRGRDALPYERAAVHALPVLSRFDQRVEHDRAKEWSEKFFDALAPAFQSWLNADVPVERLAPRLRVPHVAFWGFGEGLPVEVEALHDPEAISYALQGVAALLEHHLVDAHRLIDDRDALLAESKRRTAGYSADLLIIAEGGEAHPAVDRVRAAVDPAKKVQVRAAPDQEAVLAAASILLVTEGADTAFLRAASEVPGWVFGKGDERVNLAVLDAEPTTRRGPLGSLRHFGAEQLIAEWLPECELALPPRSATESARREPKLPKGDERSFKVWVEGGPAWRISESWATATFGPTALVVRANQSGKPDHDNLQYSDVRRFVWEGDHHFNFGTRLPSVRRVFRIEVPDEFGLREHLWLRLDFVLAVLDPYDEPSDAEIERNRYVAETFEKLLSDFTGVPLEHGSATPTDPSTGGRGS